MSSITQELPDPPCFTKFVCPTYPPFRIQGVVLIEITVAKSGEPTEIRVLEGHPMLIPATMEAAKQWRFSALRDGADHPIKKSRAVFGPRLITNR
jgi:TonB family protein